jgi:hypothetical protein
MRISYLLNYFLNFGREIDVEKTGQLKEILRKNQQKRD